MHWQCSLLFLSAASRQHEPTPRPQGQKDRARAGGEEELEDAKAEETLVKATGGLRRKTGRSKKAGSDNATRGGSSMTSGNWGDMCGMTR